MTFWISVIAMFILSLFWAILSLRREISHPKELRKVKKDLARSKILFKR